MSESKAFAEPFTLTFKRVDDNYGVWYRPSPKGFWHLYSHSQFYLWSKQTPNNNSTGDKYWYTMLKKLHFTKCGNTLRDAGEFGYLGAKLYAKDAAKKHKICRKCYKMVKAKLKEAGVIQRHKQMTADRMNKRWKKWHEEHKEDDWRNQ